MKNKFLLIFIYSFISSGIMAQGDLAIESSKDTTSDQYDKILKFFVQEKEEVKQLFKVNLFQVALLRPNFSYERKLSEKFSLELEGTLALYSRPYDNYAARFYLDGPNITYLNLNSTLRFYHNIDKRKRKGKKTNGFSANYFSFGLSSHISFYNDYYYGIYDNGDFFVKRTLYGYNYYHDPNDIPLPGDYKAEKVQIIGGKHVPRENIYYSKFGYGFQRRIGNIGYWGGEFKLGIGTNNRMNILYITPEVHLKAGFALSSLRRKK